MYPVFGLNWHVLLYIYMGLVTLPSNLAETTLTSNCKEESSADRPKINPKHATIPHLSIDLTTNLSDSSLNSILWSKLVYENCKVNVEFECVANYPVEWIEHYDQDIEVLTDINVVIKKTLWTERAIQHEVLVQYAGFNYSNYSDSLAKLPSSLTKYTAFLGIYYQRTSLCAAANYTCRSVSNPCLQSSVISVVDREKETIKYYEEPAAGSGYNEHDFQNRTCETIIEVAVNEKGRVGWKCKTSQKYPELTPYTRNCDQAPYCNSLFRYHRQQNCVKRLQSMDECSGCMFSKKSSGFLLHPGYFYCMHSPSNTIVTAHQYFHSIAQSIDPHTVPEFYLNWAEADPQKMLYLEPLPQPIYVGETRPIFCRVSRYYFSYGHRFGFEYSNGTIRYTQSIDGMHDTDQKTNRMNVIFNFTDISLKRIFCLAPVWKSTEWVNQSMNVQMLEGAIAPYFASNSGEIKHSEDEQVVLKLHEKEAKLSCKVEGQPIPETKWIFDNKSIESTQIYVEPGKTDLIFPFFNKSVTGKYLCVGKNFLGSATKTFHVIVIDELADVWAAHQYKTQLWEGTIAFSTVFLVIFVVILGVCWRKVRMQRKQIQSLSEDEIKEFRFGNSDVLGNSQYLDTQELLQAIPYNDEYEISSKRLYIDPSEILGSGNFGQVIKGAIYDGNDKRNCNVVAVKTVKSNHDISYFQTLLTEVKIMAYIGRHTNVVSLVGACTENIRNRQIFIAVEYCSKGSLERFLKNNRHSFNNLVCGDTICITTSFCGNRQNHTYENSEEPDELSTTHLLRWSREIANGMDFLGSKKVISPPLIVHGDLAARNIMLTGELVAKIGDFGLSRVLMTYSNYVRSTQDDCLLPWKWMALETLEEMKFSVMSDVWSYGVTLWEIFSLAQHPFPGVTYNTAFVGWLKSGHRLEKPFYANSEIYNVMMECWASHPSQRPTFPEMKDFFEGLLLQTCDIEYVRTKLNGTTQYMNGPASCRVQNPGYSFLGKGNLLLGKEDDDTTTESDKSSCNTSLMTTSEDYQGYMKPLMIDYGYTCKA